jgi:hypothetical protein
MPGISFRISLDGSEQVSKQLQTVAQTAEQSFASTTAAISKLGRTAEQSFATAAVAAKTFGASAADLQKVQSTIQSVADQAKANGTSFLQLARNYDRATGALGGAAATARGAAAGFAATARGARDAGKAAEESAQGFGVGRRELGAVRTALRQVNLGVAGGEIAALGRVAGVFGPLGIAITAVGAAAAGATGGLSHFANAAKETATTLGELAAAGGVPFEFMSSLQIAFATGGTTLQKFAQELGNLQEKIAATAVGLKDKLAASADEAAGATLNVEQAALALREAQLKLKSSTGQLTESQQKKFDKDRRRLAVNQAELALHAAERKEREAEANDLDDLVQKYENISQGVKQTFDPLTTLESKAKAVTAALAKVKDPKEQFAKLADIFHNLSELDRAQLGKALGLSPETIATLSKGSEAIRQMQADIERLGLALDDLDRTNLNDLKNSQSEVSALWGAMTEKMGALAAPAFTSFWQGLLERIRELAPEFIKLGEAFGSIDFSALGRAVGDFALWLAKAAVWIAQLFEALAKGDTSAIDEFFATLGQKIVAAMTTIGETIGDLLTGIMKAAFSSAADNATKDLSGKLGDGLANVKVPEDKLKGVATRAGEAFGQAFANAVKSQVKSTAQNLLPSTEDVLRDFAKFGESVAQNWEILKRKISSGFGLISPAGAAEAGGAQLGGTDFGPMIAAAEVAAARIKQIFADAFTPPTTIDFSGIITAARTAATDIGTAFSQIDIASALSAQIDALIQKFAELARAAAPTRAMAPVGGGGGSLPEEARGGLFGGRGTGTSDSNLAWVSRGEHIMPARAVRQPGVLALLEALRRSGGNLRGILDDMGHFARGGMVLPAFASGGLAGGSNVTIQFPGLPAISGLRASSDVVDQLHRAAALAQVRSGGRKPSRYS